MSFLLAIDQGTTNTKGLLVNRDGIVAHRTSSPLSLLFPQTDFVEQAPHKILASVKTVMESCIAQSHDIAAIAISNQRETVLAWERHTLRPVSNAITWQCRRATAICERLHQDGHETLLRAKTGLGIDPLFSAGKIAWLLKNIDGLAARTKAGDICFGTIDSWLLAYLTVGKQHACDHSNASRTQLMNLRAREWDQEILRLFDIPAVALPSIHTSSGFFGECSLDLKGLQGVPILAAIGDSHAALAGHGCNSPGSIKATYGTGSSLMTISRTPSPSETSRLSHTIAWTTPETALYAMEGNISMTGSAIQWLGEFLNLPNPVQDAVALAETVDDSAGVHFVPAMSGLGAPHWATNARGTITGLSRTSTRAHLALAAVESIAFQIRDVFDAMQRETGLPFPALHVDGGATRNTALMQFQADILGTPVYRSEIEDLSALGAARLAGLALGWWKDLSTLPQPVTVFSPQMQEEERASRYASWNAAVDATLFKKDTAA